MRKRLASWISIYTGIPNYIEEDEDGVLYIGADGPGAQPPHKMDEEQIREFRMKGSP